VFDQIGREVLWLIAQRAKSRHTFTLFIAMLALPGITRRGWHGSAISWNRLNEAHKRATRKTIKLTTTQGALRELEGLGVARVEYAEDGGRGKRGLKSIRLTLLNARFAAETGPIKCAQNVTTECAQEDTSWPMLNDAKQGRLPLSGESKCAQNVTSDKTGAEVRPKRVQKCAQNVTTIDIGIEGEGTSSIPLLSSAKDINDARAQSPAGRAASEGLAELTAGLATPPQPKRLSPEEVAERKRALKDQLAAHPPTHSAHPATHLGAASGRNDDDGERHG
jgi:hypothetical protein